MRMVALDDITPSMTLAKPIYDSQGRVLLGVGVSLNEQYLKKLRDIGIEQVFIKDSVSRSVEPSETISDRTRVDAVLATQEAVKNLQLGKNMNTGKVMKVVDNIIDEVISNRQMLFCLNEVRTKETQVLGHSAAVCVLSVLIGLGLGLNQLKLKQLGIGALLHDVGIAKLDPALMSKYRRGPLQGADQTKFAEHTQLGFDMLRSEDDISILSAHVAYQHHEHVDGSGWPRGIKGHEMIEFAKIVAVANCYDNLLHGRGLPKHLVHQAVQYIKDRVGTRFDQEVVKTMIRYLAVYPVGTTVQLNNGAYAIVDQVHKDFNSKPVVRLLALTDEGWTETGKLINLAQDDSKFIVSVTKI